MAVTLLDPPALPRPEHYHQVSVATGSRHVAVAGQVSVDSTGEKVGVGDFAAQVEQAFCSAAAGLAAAGATPADITTTTVYVVGWSLELWPQFAEGFTRAAARTGLQGGAPTSVIGVSVLFDPDFLVEVQVSAVVE